MDKQAIRIDFSYFIIFSSLCIRGQNPHQDPGTLATTIFSKSAGVSEFTYHDGLATSPGAGMTEGDSFFDKG